MNGFEFESDDLNLNKERLIEGIVFHAIEFGLLDPVNQANFRSFLRARIGDDQNFVVHKAAWDERSTNPEKFIYLCALAEVLPKELAPYLKA